MTSIYEKYQLKPVINASGRMTLLGVSTPSKEVAAAMAEGLEHFFDMKELVNQSGAYIADLLEVESAVVVGCASAGIAQCVAAVIAQDDLDLIVNLHTSYQRVSRKIILPKGHNVNFGAPIGTMIALGGGAIVEAGYANECTPEQISAVITEETAAILYVKSHHTVHKNMLSVEEVAQIAKQYNLPLIVDAAAEEDLSYYYRAGADLVIYSGAKTIEGPTSGLVVGKKEWVERVKKQSEGIGRAMKIGKEGILGLTRAIELYLSSQGGNGEDMAKRMSSFIANLNSLIGVTAKVVWDSAGRDIARTSIHFDSSKIGKSTKEIVARLKKGTICIYFREYEVNNNIIEVDIRSVSSEQLETIYTAIAQIINGEK